MSKNYITESISIETMAKLTDEMLNFEKEVKHRKIGEIILRMVPAVAAVVLVIGLANFIGLVDVDKLLNYNNSNGANSGAVIVEKTEEPVTATEAEAEPEMANIPRIVEKSIFENFLAMMPEGKVKRAMKSYYGVVELDKGEFYVFDQYASERETKEVLDYWNEYTNWSDKDYAKMLFDYQLLNSKYLSPADPKDTYSNYHTTIVSDYKTADIEAIESEFALRDPERYAHVRFGENKNILLLDVEWHTFETYTEEVVERQRTLMNEYKNYDLYIQFSDEEKAQVDGSNAKYLRTLERNAKQLKNGNFFMTRMINGEKRDYNFSFNTSDISELLDSNGYYIYNVYPHYTGIGYTDENGEPQTMYFGSDENGRVYSKQEFDSAMDNEALAILNELVEKGCISKQGYDNIIKDPLDYAVESFFGTADKQ